jgi:hypothetical protein
MAHARGITNWKNLGKYSRHLGKTLKDRVAELLNEQPAQQLALFEELALARTMAGEAVQLWDAACGPKAQPETKALAGSLMRDALTFVRDMALAASRVENDAKDKVSVGVFDLVIAQVCRAIHRACPDEDLAKAIEAEINEAVRFPKAQGGGGAAGGTLLTPDQVVREMDDITIGVQPNVDVEQA